jgi:hypothetical protein
LVGKKLVHKILTPGRFHLYDAVLDIVIHHFAKEIVNFIKHDGFVIVLLAT